MSTSVKVPVIWAETVAARRAVVVAAAGGKARRAGFHRLAQQRAHGRDVLGRGRFLRQCARLLKPGGRLFLSTLNRTPAAFALAIVGAEYVARMLPKGTHHYRDFIRPSELGAWLRAADLVLEDVSGLAYDPLRHVARVGGRTDVNYLACAVKP